MVLHYALFCFVLYFSIHCAVARTRNPCYAMNIDAGNELERSLEAVREYEKDLAADGK